MMVMLIAAAYAVTCGVGCGSPTAIVHGHVTYQGRPVDNGQITFTPSDGRGPITGAAIIKGKYRAVVPPGKKIVAVIAAREMAFAKTTEDDRRRAEQRKNRSMPGRELEDVADLIPPNAEGNHAKLEILAGEQALDFHLRPPRK